MILETERLILRPWKEDDAEDLYKYAKNPEVGPIAGWPVHTSVENSREIIKRVLSADETYAVCLKEDNVAIGSIGLIPPVQSHTAASDDEIEIGYWIGEPFWGNGYIPEAVRALQKHAFEDLDCSAMWCGYYDGNEKSKRCQEKCGFVYHHTEVNKTCTLMGDIRTEHFTYLKKQQWQNRQDKALVFYVHGKGGNAEESEQYRKYFSEYDVYGFDYKAENPWEAEEEFSNKLKELSKKYNRIILVAGSIGAYFSMNAGIGDYVEKAYFVSPIVNLEKLIIDMLFWAGKSEKELEEKKIIHVDFGEDLSWNYLQYIRHHMITWNVPTEILYGSNDNLQSIDTINEFVQKNGAGLTVMEGGEHWFHTEEQMRFLDEWMKTKSMI